MTSLLVAQADGRLFVRSDEPEYEKALPWLQRFAELKQQMDPVHVYEIRNVTLWQAAAMGVSAREILAFLRRSTQHIIPYLLQQKIVEETSKWGKLTLHSGAKERIVLRTDSPIMHKFSADAKVRQLALEVRDEGIVFAKSSRALVKRRLFDLGYPVIDRVGYQQSPRLNFEFLENTKLRYYQQAAVDCFLAPSHGESGVIVLPCGAGKTVVGIAILASLKLHALILVPNELAAQQWQREFSARTSLDPHLVGIYDAKRPLFPITVTTYQKVTAKARTGQRRHLAALTDYPWGIVVYDEVHLLPAPLFRLAADLQGARRLGLTATLIREDGAIGDVFSLIGAKCFDVPWKQLEQEGYVAKIRCVLVRVPFSKRDGARYDRAPKREQHRLAAENVEKSYVVTQLIARHPTAGALVIGHYLDALRQVAADLGHPLLTGQTKQKDREERFAQFRAGEIRCLVLSRIANMAVDLPCASIAIQISGLFGSRQEEAQRLGRLLRPQTSEGVFYTLVTSGTVEEEMARRRQLYLVEQGYAYEVIDASDLEEDEAKKG